MTACPGVDVTLFVHNGAAHVGAAIESVLVQTWPAIALTLIDDGSSDGTAEILRDYAGRHPCIRLKTNRHNAGAIPNFQRAFWFGDADFVMPKSGDDLIAPDFVECAMAVLQAHPGCAMAHAAGLIITGDSDVAAAYPPEHNLDAASTDRLERARHVMARYTSSPAFWGIYRREAVDALSPIRYRAGWDHVVLAELALYGEIRHVPQPLYWRRDGGKPVARLARAATAQGCAGLPLNDVLAEHRWRTPLITTAHAHQEMFAASCLAGSDRLDLMRAVPEVFRARWLPLLRREAERFNAELPTLIDESGREGPIGRDWRMGTLSDVLRACRAIVPEVDMTWALPALAPAAMGRAA